MTESWLDRVIPSLVMDDLPESYQGVARVVGIENAVRLAEHLGGLNFYFPQADKMLRAKRNELIRKEFNGVNYKDLAQKYHLSEIQIREITARPKHDQPKLF